MKYFKSESYYSDLYDRFTVDECRRWEKRGISEDHTVLKDSEPKENKIKKDFKVKVVIPTALYFIKGDRYTQKTETIREWMDRDRAKDDLLASAKPPEGIQCLICRSILNPTFKDLHDWGPDGKDRVLFMYDCPKGCLPRRAFFDDGEEWRHQPYLCSKCKNEMEEKNSRKGNIITTIYNCSKCGNKEKDVWDLDEKPKIRPEESDLDFEKDRQRFCMTGKEGQEYIESKIHLENFSKLMKGMKDKQETKEKIADIKKLSVAGLKELLTPLLEKEEYIKLEFFKPEIDRDVIIQFNIQDNKSDRGEYDSTHHLQKIIKSVLEKTNWRLMSEGVYYKLGILSGRLRGYETDEDLLGLAKKSK